MLVRIRCADGIEGWGEATTIGGLAYGEESPESIKTNIDTYIAPLLIGMDATQSPSAHGERCARPSRATASPSARSRRRCWTRRRERLGVPLSELLGGRVRDALPVAWTLASGDTGKDIAEAEHMLDSAATASSS